MNINNGNVFIANRSWNNNWQHGNWNGSNWNHWNHSNSWWNGYWHGYQNGFWDRPWYAHPVAWGMGAWAIGSIYYNSGYGYYSNPYYEPVASSPVYYDYSQPIQVVNQQSAPADDGSGAAAYPPEVAEGTSHTDKARNAFSQGNYADAMKEVDLALQKLPNDAALHELRALIQFATKDYKAAAATLFAVLSAGPGWDWTTLASMYPSVDTYTTQLRALEQYVKANLDDPAGHFVLAYHYITQGHSDAAARQLKDVVRLQPDDQLAANLLKSVGGSPAEDTAAPPAAESPDAAETPQFPDVDASQLVGKWSATRKDGTTFTLTMSADSKFTWAYARGTQKPQEFSGTYSVDGAILVLARADGAEMPGLVTLSDAGFNFKLYGGPEKDPGLDFKK